MLLPSEIEARLILPLLRALIVKKLVSKYGYTQEKIANVLGITQASVSNYLRQTRAKTRLWENNEFLNHAADEIVKLIIDNEDSKVIRKKMYKTLLKMRREGMLCYAHKYLEPDIDKECDVCKE